MLLGLISNNWFHRVYIIRLSENRILCSACTLHLLGYTFNENRRSPPHCSASPTLFLIQPFGIAENRFEETQWKRAENTWKNSCSLFRRGYKTHWRSGQILNNNKKYKCVQFLFFTFCSSLRYVLHLTNSHLSNPQTLTLIYYSRSGFRVGSLLRYRVTYTVGVNCWPLKVEISSNGLQLANYGNARRQSMSSHGQKK